MLSRALTLQNKLSVCITQTLLFLKKLPESARRLYESDLFQSDDYLSDRLSATEVGRTERRIHLKVGGTDLVHDHFIQFNAAMLTFTSTWNTQIGFFERLIDRWRSEYDLHPLSIFNHDKHFNYDLAIEQLSLKWNRAFKQSIPSDEKEYLAKSLTSSILVFHWMQGFDIYSADLLQIYFNADQLLYKKETAICTEWALLLAMGLDVCEFLFESLHQFFACLPLEQFGTIFDKIWTTAVLLLNHDLISADEIVCLLASVSGCDKLFLSCSQKLESDCILPWSKLLCILEIIDQNTENSGKKLLKPLLTKYLDFVIIVTSDAGIGELPQRNLMLALLELPSNDKSRSLSFLSHKNNSYPNKDSQVRKRIWITARDMVVKMKTEFNLPLATFMDDILTDSNLIISGLLFSFEREASDIIETKSYLETDDKMNVLTQILKLWPSARAVSTLLSGIAMLRNTYHYHQLKTAFLRILLDQSVVINQQLFKVCSSHYKHNILPLMMDDKKNISAQLNEFCNKVTQNSKDFCAGELGNLIEFCWYNPYLVIKELVRRSMDDVSFCDTVSLMLRDNAVFDGIRHVPSQTYSSLIMTITDLSVNATIKNVCHITSAFLEAGVINSTDIAQLMTLPHLLHHHGNIIHGNNKQQLIAIELCGSVIAAVLKRNGNVDTVMAILSNLLFLVNDISDELNIAVFASDIHQTEPQRVYVEGINLLDRVSISLLTVLNLIKQDLQTNTCHERKIERLSDKLNKCFKKQHWSSQLYLHPLLLSNNFPIKIIIPSFITLYYCTSTVVNLIIPDEKRFLEDHVSSLAKLLLIGKRSPPAVFAAILREFSSQYDDSSNTPINQRIAEALALVSVTCTLSQCTNLFEAVHTMVAKLVSPKSTTVCRPCIMSRLYVDAYMKTKLTVPECVCAHVSKLYLIEFGKIQREMAAKEAKGELEWTTLASVFDDLITLCGAVPKCTTDEARAVAIPMATQLLSRIDGTHETEIMIRFKTSLLRCDQLFAG